VPVLFAITLFVSASLLFMVQPMVGKMILPLLGGSPAAWNTCMVFFQALLLFGYLYAHNLTTKYQYRPSKQVAIHLGVLGLAVAWMAGAAMLAPNSAPVAVFKSLAPQGQSYPMFGVMALLAVAIGLPFLVVSTSAPLLQRWFAYTGHPSAKDPYFLYAASNAGSLIALLGYPLFIEPSLTLANQAWIWASGFVLLMVLVYFCGQAASNPVRPVLPKSKPSETTPGDATPPSLGQKLRWMMLAFVPSSLMLGVTFHMTTDIASIPLLWVIPLALYLLTFIIAYARTPSWFRPVLANLSPVMMLLLVFVMVSNVTAKSGFTQFMALSVHLVVYFFTALLMHTELARERPDPNYLTGYFLWISFGGVLGGIFNALIAPVAFPLAYEYPIALAVACLLVPSLDETAPPAETRWRRVLVDILVPLGMVALAAWLTLLPERSNWFIDGINWLATKATRLVSSCGLDFPVSADTIRLLAVYALPCMICFFFIDRPIRFGLCVVAVLSVCYYRSAQSELVDASDRSFFGILRVESYSMRGRSRVAFQPTTDRGKDETAGDYTTTFGTTTDEKTGTESRLGIISSREQFRKLSHGTTLHGEQFANNPRFPVHDHAHLLGAATPWDALLIAGAETAFDFRQEPLTYYHRTGPVGSVFHRLRAVNRTGHVAMIGLGTGTVAAYALPGQKLTFYEIDPSVQQLIESGKYFTYVADARKRGADVEIVLGDARLKLEEHTDRKYALILVDAFSSDSIPVHLLTKQAMELYKNRLAEHGLLAVHISNRYIDLAPVVAKLASETGLVARLWSDNDAGPPEGDGPPGKSRSSWIVLARSVDDLGDELHGIASDTRFGAVSGGYGYQIFNHNWQPLNYPKEKLAQLRTWTDDYSDVTAVMRLKEVQWVRRLFGLPTPLRDDDD
jgi:hypothetical protein